jgi:tRNA/tmRNA/rRNA uracil-C5-methylase (TrmA/RlmC/RlmD family)
MKLSIEKLVPNGLGLARHNGEVLLLPGALPGEDVSAEFGEMARGARRARVTEVLSASPFRVAADCPLAGVCGGCDFLHVAPAEALRLKAEAALGDLAERAGVAIELIQSPRSSRYRGRATVHLEAKAGGGVGVGFYSSPELRPNGERSLVEFADCLLLTEELNGLLEPLRRWASALPAGAGGAEISLLQGEADSGLAVHFSPKPNPRPAGRGKRPEPSRLSPILLKALAGLPPLLAEAGGPETAVFARAEERGRARKLSSGGRERLPMAVWPEFGLTLCAAPGGFTQVNPAVNRRMVK